MAGIEFRLELRNEEARLRLQSILDGLENPGPLLASIGQILADSTRARFRSETDPDGNAWTPLRPATIRARARRGRSQIRILSETGTLAGTIRHEVTGNRVEIGASTPYAAIHQFGGTIERTASARWMAGRRFARRDRHPDGAEKAIRAHAITIPARPYLGASAEDEAAILAAAQDELAGIF